VKALRVIALIVGILLVLNGLLWTGQGLGIIMWPASSFMLVDSKWAVNGSVTALVGAVLVWWSRRRSG